MRRIYRMGSKLCLDLGNFIDKTFSIVSNVLFRIISITLGDKHKWQGVKAFDHDQMCKFL